MKRIHAETVNDAVSGERCSPGEVQRALLLDGNSPLANYSLRTFFTEDVGAIFWFKLFTQTIVFE